MARPREFDVDTALDAAMQTFWLHGYGATSVGDLVAATGVSRSGLYGEWGDKHGLFLAALERYFQRVGLTWMGQLDAAPDALDGIRDTFRTISGLVLADDQRHGCFALNSALELGRHDDVAQAVIRGLLDQMQAAFVRAVARARDQGRLDPSVDPEAHGRHLAVVFQAVLLQARTRAPAPTLEAFVTLSLSTLPEVSR